MAETADFQRDPLEFLRTRAVVVPAEMDSLLRGSTRRVERFRLFPEAHNVYWLDLAGPLDPESIGAYYLPWEAKGAPAQTLGPDADFFFTSHMTNCRFTVLDPNPRTPRVSHIAGDLNPSERQKAENKLLGIDEKLPKNKVLVRRLSQRDCMGARALHTYAGQDGRPASSAFVFGKGGASGDWKFYAQITAGVRTETPDSERLAFSEAVIIQTQPGGGHLYSFQ